MKKENVSSESVHKANIVFALKNRAFNALMFVFSSLLRVYSEYDSEARYKELLDLFRPVYDSLSKEFVPNIGVACDHGEEGHEPDAKSAYKG